jgi:hypothetical protein
MELRPLLSGMSDLDAAWFSRHVPGPFQHAFDFIAAECASLEDDGWIIGSTAALLSGLLHPLPEDVDLLVSAGDAYRLLARWKTQCTPCTPSNLFHSVFGVFTVATVDIEVMGDLEISTDHGWRRLKPKSRESMQFDSGPLSIPTREEQISILRLFGRPKDLTRARALESGA